MIDDFQMTFHHIGKPVPLESIKDNKDTKYSPLFDMDSTKALIISGFSVFPVVGEVLKKILYTLFVKFIDRKPVDSESLDISTVG